MGRYRKRPWLNPKDVSRYEIQEITAFSVDYDGSNWYEVQWARQKNGRPWRSGGNVSWQRESVLMADGVRKPIQEFWSSLKAQEGKTKQSERERILAVNSQELAAAQQTLAAQENQKLAIAQKKTKPIGDLAKAATGSRTGSGLTRSRSSASMPPEVLEDAESEEEEDASDTEDDETLLQIKKRLLVEPKQYVQEQFRAASMEELGGIKQSRTDRAVVGESSVTAKTTSSDLSSANSESGLSVLDESAIDHHEAAENKGENTINGAVMENIASTGDDVLAEELIAGTEDCINPIEEMPDADEQPDMSASEYRGRLTPDFEPSSRRAKEFFKLPFAKFTRGVSAFADLRGATTTAYFDGEDDEADEFCREMNAAAWKARNVSLQVDPDLDDVFTDDENDSRIVKPSFKYDLYAGCTVEQIWAMFKANPVEPGGNFDWKAFWKKYCRERGLPTPVFEEGTGDSELSEESDEESDDEAASDGDEADEEAMESESDDEFAGVGGLSFADAVAQRNQGHAAFLSDDSETETESDSASENGGSKDDE